MIHEVIDRGLRKVGVEVLKRMPDEKFADISGKGLFPTSEVVYINNRIRGESDDSREWQIALNNFLPIGNRAMLLANRRAHPDQWLRDCAYTAPFFDMPVFEDNMLKAFEAKQRSNGQIPTAIGVLGSTPWHYADDESTMLYVIWRSDLQKRSNGEFPAPKNKMRAALSFIGSHVEDDTYLTGKGDRKGWLDSFIFDKPDVVIQNQGLLGVAMLSADRDGLITPIDPQKAIFQYQNSAMNGFMPFSRVHRHSPDASVLYPAFLAATLLGEDIVSKELVEDTIAAVPKSEHGVRVLAYGVGQEGNYFPSDRFLTGYKAGEYQNGGVWPFWHNNLMVVGELYGVVKPQDYRPQVQDILTRSDYAESIYTGGDYERVLTPRAPGHVWNLAVKSQQEIADKMIAKVT